MGRTELKQRAFAYIDSIRETIIRHGKTVEGMPELGYREQRTSAYVKQEMERLSLADVRNVAYTGVASALRPRAGGENVCLIGELDAVLTPDCPYADPATGAAHTCGHNIQIAQLLGCADAIKNSGIARELDGNVTFLAVPAEEFHAIPAGKYRLKSSFLSESLRLLCNDSDHRMDKPHKLKFHRS